MANNIRGFNSKFGTIMAATGGAVGLGNIWRFPYTAGSNGGGAFLIIYFLFVLFLGLPVMLSEETIGRRAQKNVLGAFKVLAPKHKIWMAPGLISIVTAIVIYSFYSVVAGWTLNYIIASASGLLSGKSPDEITEFFNTFTSNSIFPLIYQFIFLLLTIFIINRGVKDGIEKCTKILMPILLLLLIVMCIRSLTLEGAYKGVEFLFKPDFSKLDGNSILDALGQAMFSLSIGMGALITYGSYMLKQDNLFTTSLWIAGADTLVAILAGVAIFPAVFAFGLEPTSGPSLVYIVLPNVFNSMSGGTVFAVAFFILLSIAALTSTISLLEVPVLWANESFSWGRRKASLIFSALVFVLGIFCSLSFGCLSNFTICGKTVFDLFDFITANLLMPIGAIFFTLLIGWHLPKADVYDELSNSGAIKPKLFNIFYFIIRYIAPLALLVVLISGLL